MLQKNFKLDVIDNNYKQAWAKLWETLSSEDKNFFKKLTNFDADIFEQITGIEFSKESEEVLNAIEVLTKAGKIVDGKIINF